MNQPDRMIKDCKNITKNRFSGQTGLQKFVKHEEISFAPKSQPTQPKNYETSNEKQQQSQ